MKKVMKCLGVIILLFILFYLTIFVVNNHIAKRQENRLLHCQLPADAQFVDSVAIAGKVSGNGNGMQWIGAGLIESDQSEEALYDWFEAQMDLDENHEMIEIAEQNTPYVFENQKYRFSNYNNSEKCYQIRLTKVSVSGMENSFLEKLLNCDLRAH